MVTGERPSHAPVMKAMSALLLRVAGDFGRGFDFPPPAVRVQVAIVLGLTGENVLRRAETSEGLLGRGGPDDPDWMLVPGQRHSRIQAEPLQRSVKEWVSHPSLIEPSAPPLPTPVKGATMTMTQHHVDTVGRDAFVSSGGGIGERLA